MKPSVLIVDDEKVICEGLEQLLSEDYTVYMAFNGREALDIINSRSDIDIILCDIMMPVMDGLELIEKVRSTDKEIIIVAFTGVYSGEKVCDAIEKGADKYLLKPVDVPQLELTLKMLLMDKKSSKDNIPSE